MTGDDSRPPLAVDLDGTLISVDTLHEGLLRVFKGDVRNTIRLASRVSDGKAAFKRLIAAEANFDPSLLPYNETFLAYLRAEKERGRRIGLFTAADQSIADAVGDYLGIFDTVRGSDGAINLSGDRKLAAIRDEFGDHFAYAGDAKVDAPLFAAANASVLVGARVSRLEGMVGPSSVIEMRFPTPKLGMRIWAKALRIPHWAKNALVFLAPAVGFGMLDGVIAVQAILLFVAMGLLASATYLLNDLLDLPADRAHPVKRNRPIAAGLVPAKKAIVMGLALGLAAFAIALTLPWATLLSLVGYLIITLVYSFALKRIAIIDVFVLAGLFTLRVYAGSTLLPTPASPWLLTFSMLFFLGLAMIKRYAELERVVSSGGAGVISRGYSAKDLPLVIAAGVSSGFGAIAILMMYLMAEQYPSGQYTRPGLLWGLIPVILIWTLRVWHRAVHGRMNEDPLMFAMHDRFSLGLAVFSVLILFFAWLPA
jgi:4-hydroxybenzoate polyprenyltransferase